MGSQIVGRECEVDCQILVAKDNFLVTKDRVGKGGLEGSVFATIAANDRDVEAFVAV